MFYCTVESLNRPPVRRFKSDNLAQKLLRRLGAIGTDNLHSVCLNQLAHGKYVNGDSENEEGGVVGRAPIAPVVLEQNGLTDQEQDKREQDPTLLHQELPVYDTRPCQISTNRENRMRDKFGIVKLRDPLQILGKLTVQRYKQM